MKASFKRYDASDDHPDPRGDFFYVPDVEEAVEDLERDVEGLEAEVGRLTVIVDQLTEENAALKRDLAELLCLTR